MNTSTHAQATPADNRFDRAAEQFAAQEKLRDLAAQEQRRTLAGSGGALGGDFLSALDRVKAKHPRLAAISENRVNDDAALAAAGHEFPLPHLRD